MFLISSMSSLDDKLSGCFAFELAQLLRLIKTIVKFTIFNYSVEKVWQHWPTTSKSCQRLRAQVQEWEYVYWACGSEMKRSICLYITFGDRQKIKVRRKRRLETCPVGERKEQLSTRTKKGYERSKCLKAIWICLLYPFSFPTIFDWVLAKQWMREIIPQLVPFPLKTLLRSPQVVSQFHIA